MLVRGGVQHHLGPVAGEDLVQALRVADGAHAEDELLLERIAVEELELAKEVVHVVFANVVEDDALRLKGQETAAQLAADGPAAAGDEHGFPAEERGDRRHVQLLLGAAQEVPDVDVAHQRGGHGGVASQLLQGREAAHAAAGGQAFFDEGLEIALGRGDGDDDLVHAVVAGELEDVA